MMLVTAFVVVDLGIMAITSQLATGPSNELLAGTTPVQQLMAAHLAPGARMVNYDPQTYDELSRQSPGNPGPQHRAGAALGIGVRLDRQQHLRVGDPHARAGGPRHRAARVRDALAARPARGGDAARVLLGAHRLHAGQDRRRGPASPSPSEQTRCSSAATAPTSTTPPTPSTRRPVPPFRPVRWRRGTSESRLRRRV